MAGTTFSAASGADCRDSEADRDVGIGTACALVLYFFAAGLKDLRSGTYDLAVARLASCRAVANLSDFHGDPSVMIEMTFRLLVSALCFPAVIFIFNGALDALLDLCVEFF